MPEVLFTAQAPSEEEGVTLGVVEGSHTFGGARLQMCSCVRVCVAAGLVNTTMGDSFTAEFGPIVTRCVPTPSPHPPAPTQAKGHCVPRRGSA